MGWLVCPNSKRVSQHISERPFHKRDRKTMSMVGGGRATSMASLTAPRTHVSTVLSCARGLEEQAWKSHLP